MASCSTQGSKFKASLLMRLGDAGSPDISVANKIPLTFSLCPNLMSELCEEKKHGEKKARAREREVAGQLSNKKVSESIGLYKTIRVSG